MPPLYLCVCVHHKPDKAIPTLVLTGCVVELVLTDWLLRRDDAQELLENRTDGPCLLRRQEDCQLVYRFAVAVDSHRRTILCRELYRSPSAERLHETREHHK